MLKTWLYGERTKLLKHRIGHFVSIYFSIQFFSQSSLSSTHDTYIEKFEVENGGVCGAMIKRQHEITKAEALKRKYAGGKFPMINYQTNKSEYMYVAVLLFYQF